MNENRLSKRLSDEAVRLAIRSDRCVLLATRYSRLKVRRYVHERDEKLNEARSIGKHLYRRQDQWVIE